ncbi:hypothetical protein GTG23_00310 [Rhodococcus hoagii]|nr:hypothetical protein [Prescottella equi]
MSTAERIIAEVVAEHTPMQDNGPFGDDPWTGCAGKDCADWPGGDDEAFDAHVAAHAVAALTNAGKAIVDQDAEAKAFDLAADVVHAEARWQHEQDRRGTVGAQIVAQRMLVMEGAIRRFAAETREALAAARVAEGGERGEATS